MKLSQRFSIRVLAGCFLVIFVGMGIQHLMTRIGFETRAVSHPLPVPIAPQIPLEKPKAMEAQQILETSPLRAPKIELAVPNEIESLVKRELAGLTEMLRDTERSNASVVYDRHGQSHVVALRVKAPTREQMDPAYSSISRTLEALSEHPKAEKQYRSQAEQLLGSYNQFPKPFVVLRMSVAHDGSRSLFSKQFTTSETEGIPNESGIVRIDGLNLPEMDGEWGTTSSWATKRYGYLFQIEEE